MSRKSVYIRTVTNCNDYTAVCKSHLTCEFLQSVFLHVIENLDHASLCQFMYMIATVTSTANIYIYIYNLNTQKHYANLKIFVLGLTK